MRRSLVALIALSGFVFVSSALASVSASVTPSTVDFGRVEFESGCVVDANDVPSGECVTRTLTVTNTGTEPLEGVGAGACETLLLPENSCFTLHAGWGGFTGSQTSTCIFGVIQPGASCTVVLVASPTRPGRITGFFKLELYSAVSDQTIILAVPIRLLSVPNP